MTDAVIGLLGQWSVYLVFAAGLALIIKGGDLFVDGASWIATASGIPKFIVGATVVSLATTLPELIVSCIGAANGTDAGVALATGNAIGSVTANTGLILSLGILFMPGVVSRRQFAPKAALLVLAVGFLWALSYGGRLTLPESIVLFIVFLLFIAENIAEGAKSKDMPAREKATAKDAAVNIAKFLLGVIGIVLGSNFLVDSGTIIAAELGVPDRVIGLTMVAIGTSLPELVTAISAIVKKEASLSVGNILGANIIDTTLILPLCSAIKGGSLPVERSTFLLDMPFCLAVTLVALLPTVISKRLCRWQGVVMLAAYAGYLVFMAI